MAKFYALCWKIGFHDIPDIQTDRKLPALLDCACMQGEAGEHSKLKNTSARHFRLKFRAISWKHGENLKTQKTLSVCSSWDYPHISAREQILATQTWQNNKYVNNFLVRAPAYCLGRMPEVGKPRLELPGACNAILLALQKPPWSVYWYQVM